MIREVSVGTTALAPRRPGHDNTQAANDLACTVLERQACPVTHRVFLGFGAAMTYIVWLRCLISDVRNMERFVSYAMLILSFRAFSTLIMHKVLKLCIFNQAAIHTYTHINNVHKHVLHTSAINDTKTYRQPLNLRARIIRHFITFK